VAAQVIGLFLQDRWLTRPRPRAVLGALWIIPILVAAAAVGLSRRRVIAEPPPAAYAPARSAPSPLPNVVLVSVDTLRADHLSLYGYDRDTTPNLRHLASESLVFTHALSPGTWTLPGHAAMLTGRFPGALGTLGWNGSLPRDVPLLAERLRQGGYRTCGVVGNSLFLDRRLGWDRGFDFYADQPRREVGYTPILHTALRWFPRLLAHATAPWKSAEEINRTAFAWMAQGGPGPFFLFVNYVDTHVPYMAPDPWPDRFPGRLPLLLDPVPAVQAGERDLTEAESGHYRALYDGAVAYVDAQIGVLLADLEARGELERSVVIVTSDHGEFLGEHRLFHHAVGPYEPVHRIPLLIRYPQAARRGVEDRWVQLVDIVPTVLAATGLPLPVPLDGQVLPEVNHAILIEQMSMPGTRWRGRHVGRGYAGVYDGPWKFVAFDDGPTWLFNLDDDRGEARDVSGASVGEVTRLRACLEAARERFPRRAEPAVPSLELQERLRAGGYLR